MKQVTTNSDEEREINIRLQNGGFLHKEAYCLMEYHCKSCNKSLIVWNSRDGVTPFIISCPECGKEMRHINWHGDRRVVDHIPRKGNYIFLDMPKEIHDLYIRKRIESMWEGGGYPMKEHFKSKQEAFEKLSGTFEKGQPFMMKWEA